MAIFFMLFDSKKAFAEINNKRLSAVVKSCLDNPPGNNEFIVKVDQGYIANYENQCIIAKYAYETFISRFNELKYLGNLRPGFPSSVYIASFLTNETISQNNFLDCMISQDSKSNDCSSVYPGHIFNYICRSCFSAYSHILEYDSRREVMKKDLVIWFYSLDKASRRYVIDSLNKESRKQIMKETSEAFNLYNSLKDKVKKENQEQKRHNLIQ